ncbi:MAG: hypothetical protein GY771_05330 [bacterium]|nr:hypothetical protein [bacterium]
MEHTGGGYYTLSDGSRVRGKAKAVAAEAALGGGGRTLAKVAGAEDAPKRKLAKVVET